MNTTISEEERIRQAFGVIVETTPMGHDLDHLVATPVGGRVVAWRRVGLVAATLLVAALLLGPAMLLLSRGGSDKGIAIDPAVSAPSTTDVVASGTSEAPVSTTLPLDLELNRADEGFFMVQQEPSTGDLIGWNPFGIWRSQDDGQNWEPWYGVDQDGPDQDMQRLDFLGDDPDGDIVVVRNYNQRADDPAFAPGADVNLSAEVHRYDPVADTWEIIELPRPEIPEGATAATEEDAASADCVLFGLQSWVNGTAIATSPEKMAIVGSHRVSANGICDEYLQFLWVSPDGTDWTLIDEIDIDGYLYGLTWTGEHFVAYGSAIPPHIFAGTEEPPKVWTSTDLSSWTEVDLDLSPLPEKATVRVERFMDGNAYYRSTFEQLADGSLTITFLVLQAQAIEGLDTGLADLDALQEVGQLTLTSPDGTTWHTSYAEGAPTEPDGP